MMKKIFPIAALMVMCLPIQGAERSSSFSIAILPDTQKYSRYNPAMFEAQTEWIVDHALSEPIAFTAHLGDFVDRYNRDYEWQNADKAMRILDHRGIPYSVLAGNHDLSYSGYKDNERDSQRESFLRYFPAERTQNHPSYGGHSPSDYNSYFIFQEGGQEFLVLALDWRLSDESFDWAQSVLDQYADIPTILTTHDMLNKDRDEGSRLSSYGWDLWDRLVAPNNQIFLVVNGHHHGVAHRVMTNNVGNDVLLMLVNFQTDYMGGNGMMRLLTIDLTNNLVRAETFSPYVMNLPADKRGENDLERLTDSANQFTVEIDIRDRIVREWVW